MSNETTSDKLLESAKQAIRSNSPLLEVTFLDPKIEEEMRNRLNVWLSGGFPIPDDLKTWLLARINGTADPYPEKILQVIPAHGFVARYNHGDDEFICPIVCFALVECNSTYGVIPMCVDYPDGTGLIDFCRPSDEGFCGIHRI